MKSSTVISAAALSGMAAASPFSKRQAVVPQASSFGPFTFTSTYNLVASPDKVINGTTVTPGEAGSIGFYNYGINSELDIICYNITLMGVTGPYSSPAITATHIHEAAEGASGPPRIAFPNPEPADSGPDVVKRSAGCIQGPFSTGIQVNGADSGAGFRLAQIEANPAGFFTDSHTVVSVPGVVRAQLVANAPGAIVPGAVPGAVGGLGGVASSLPPEVAPADLGGCNILGFSITTRPLVLLCLTPGFGSGGAAAAVAAAPAAVAPAAVAPDAVASVAVDTAAAAAAAVAAAPTVAVASVAVDTNVAAAVTPVASVAAAATAAVAAPASLQALPGAAAPAGGQLLPLPGA